MPPISGTAPSEAHRREARIAKVALLRRALPAAAGLLVIVCIVQVAVHNLSTPAPAAAASDGVKMLKPRFSGRAPDGRSFVLTGQEGVRQDDKLGHILIAAPVLTMRTGSDRTRRVTAKSGVFDEAGHSLVLTGDVRMDNGAGTRFAATEATIDTRTGAVSGQKGLQVAGASGQVQSQDFSADDQGDRVILKGGVRGRLNTKD